MTSFNFIHTADLHWGAHYEHPIYHHNAIREICENALSNSCECAVIAGDIFDKPNPNQTIKDHFVEQILEYNDRIHFVILVGNHDYATKSMEYHSLNYLKYLDKVSSGTSNISVIEPGNGKTITFPSGSSAYFFGMNAWGDLSNYSPVGEYRVLLWHGILPGIDFEAQEFCTKSIKASVLNVLKQARGHYLALGDIHKNIQFSKRCAYSGPPVQKSYVDSYGISLVELNGKEINTTRIQLNLPIKRLLDMTSTGIDQNDTGGIVSYVLDNVCKGDIVKLSFSVPTDQWSILDRDSITAKLSEYCSIKFVNKPVSLSLNTEIVDKLNKSKTVQEELMLVIEDLCEKKSVRSVYKFCDEIVRRFHDSAS